MTDSMVCVNCGLAETAAYGSPCTAIRHIWATLSPVTWATLSPDTCAQPLPAQPDTYALDHLREHLTYLRNTHAQFLRRIEEHAAEAVRLEDEAADTECKIASIRALIALAGGTV